MKESPVWICLKEGLLGNYHGFGWFGQVFLRSRRQHGEPQGGSGVLAVGDPKT